MVTDIDIARLVYGNHIVYNERNRLIASSQERLDESLESGYVGWDNIGRNDLPSFCILLPYYTISMKDAWGLVEVAIRDDYEFRLTARNDEYVAEFKMNDDWLCRTSKSGSMAICKAFILFKEKLS